MKPGETYAGIDLEPNRVEQTNCDNIVVCMIIGEAVLLMLCAEVVCHGIEASLCTVVC